MMGTRIHVIIVHKQNKRCNVMATVLEMELLTTMFSSLNLVIENGIKSNVHRLTRQQISQLVIVSVTIAEIVMNFVFVLRKQDPGALDKMRFNMHCHQYRLCLV